MSFELVPQEDLKGKNRNLRIIVENKSININIIEKEQERVNSVGVPTEIVEIILKERK